VHAALALGTPPAEPAAEPVVIEVAFDGDGASLRALVRASGSKTGERELKTDGADCTKLSESVAVVVAVLLDLVPPEAIASFDVPGTTPLATPVPPPLAPAPAPAPAPPPPHPPAPSSRAAPVEHPLAVWLRAEGGIAVGPLGPVVSPWFGGAAGVRRERWQLGLGGAWYAPREVPFDAVPGTHIDLSLAAGSAEGCLGFPEALGKDWDMGACAVFSAGALTGAGKGFDHEETKTELWLVAGPRADLHWRLSRSFALRLALGGLVTLGKRTFAVSGYGEAFTTPPVSAFASLGPELVIY
jgi:hypothetical protein